MKVVQTVSKDGNPLSPTWTLEISDDEMKRIVQTLVMDVLTKNGCPEWLAMKAYFMLMIGGSKGGGQSHLDEMVKVDPFIGGLVMAKREHVQFCDQYFKDNPGEYDKWADEMVNKIEKKVLDKLTEQLGGPSHG